MVPPLNKAELSIPNGLNGVVDLKGYSTKCKE